MMEFNAFPLYSLQTESSSESFVFAPSSCPSHDRKPTRRSNMYAVGWEHTRGTCSLNAHEYRMSTKIECIKMSFLVDD